MAIQNITNTYREYIEHSIDKNTLFESIIKSINFLKTIGCENANKSLKMWQILEDILKKEFNIFFKQNMTCKNCDSLYDILFDTYGKITEISCMNCMDTMSIKKFMSQQK